MVFSTSPLFVDELVNCMAESRVPTDAERAIVAQRIWSDGAPLRSAFAWESLSISSPDRLASMRAADLAFYGCLGSTQEQEDQ
jgi:hypothetical protein